MTQHVPTTQEEIEGALAVAETYDRATMSETEKHFRKVLTQWRNGLITDREAYAETCELMGVPVVLNAPWWVYIQRDHSDTDLAVGPYPDQESATLAMNEALLITGFCEEDCLDCWISMDQPEEPEKHEIVVVDLDDPDHTGAPDPDDA